MLLLYGREGKGHDLSWRRKRFKQDFVFSSSSLKQTELTGDGELGGGVTQRNELLSAAVVVDNDVHGVGAQRDVIGSDGQGGGGVIRHLPVLTCPISIQHQVSFNTPSTPVFSTFFRPRTA